MLLIDTTADTKKSFQHGFWKGLGSPLLVFSNFSAPKLAPVEPVSVPASNGLYGDWMMVGNDIQAAADQHGKKAKAAK